MSDCIECGMWVDPKEPYHPYAACLMFKGCKDGNVVQANLDAVRAFGAQYDSGFDDLADRYAALEARNAEQFRLMGQYMENAEAAHERIAELEAALNKAVGAFETIGFHLPKDNLEAVDEAILIARGFNAWYDSTKETSCEHHWMPATQDGSLAIIGRGCSKCGAWETKGKQE